MFKKLKNKLNQEINGKLDALEKRTKELNKEVAEKQKKLDEMKAKDLEKRLNKEKSRSIKR